jgi:hypothetical protein
MTNTSCTDDSCGYVRNGTVAYHGFSGPSKLFLIEFSMPLSSVRDDKQGDTPAAWMLNAQIPRTQEYGECSCYPGCGEFDVFEVLMPGYTKCISQWHGNQGGGTPSWFDRPVSGTIKVAVILDGSESAAKIVVLNDSTSFETTMSAADVLGFVGVVPEAMVGNVTLGD